MEKSNNSQTTILDALYLKYIRNQAQMADDSEDKRFRRAKYWRCLRLLVDAWRRAWPDCRLKLTGCREEEGIFEALVFVDLEFSVLGNPGSRFDQLRGSFRFADSDDLVINFCRVAHGVTENFYDWQQESLRRSLEKT